MKFSKVKEFESTSLMKTTEKEKVHREDQLRGISDIEDDLQGELLQ